MKRLLGEPERWSDRTARSSDARRFRAPAEDELGALFRRVQQATLPVLPERATAANSRVRAPLSRLIARLVLVAIALLATGGAVKAARFVWRALAARPQSLVVSSGSNALVSGRARRRFAVLGPARLDFDRDDRVDVTLEGGAVTAEAGDEALRIEANGLLITMPAGATGKVAGARGNSPVVDALAGDLRLEPRANEPAIKLPAGRRWPEAVPLAHTPAAPTPVMAAASEPVAAPAPLAHSSSEVGEGRRSRESGEVEADEASWLARAFHAVRVDGDGAVALRALDERARRFPDGALSNEARVARIEALLALGRTSEALPLLLSIKDPSQGLTRGIQLARAEILAEQDHCPEATNDFDELVAAEVRDDVDERALYGRAGCRLRTGDTARARQDLRRYAELYPDGRFIGAVHQASNNLGAIAQ